MSESGLQKLRRLGYQFWLPKLVKNELPFSKEKEIFYLLGERVLIAGNLKEFSKYLRFVPSISRVLGMTDLDIKDISKNEALEKDFNGEIDYPERAYDVNWGTAAEISTEGESINSKWGDIFENYTIPNHINTTNWTIKYELSASNLDDATFANITGYCYDNTDNWIEVFSQHETNTGGAEEVHTEESTLQDNCFIDKEKIETKIIIWAKGSQIKIGNLSYYESNITWRTYVTNITTIESELTGRNEYWNISLKIFDGENWSLTNNSDNLTIQNTPPLWSLNENLTWTEDTSTVIDLNQKVFDPDGDSLTFNYTPHSIENISIKIHKIL